MSIDFSADDTGIDFSKDDFNAASAPAPQIIDFNARAKQIQKEKKNKETDYVNDEYCRAIDNPVSTLMRAANLLKLETDFEYFDGNMRKHDKGGEPPRVGLKICRAKCGECEVKSAPHMMKKDAKADACAKLLPELKSAYGDWNKIRTNRRNNPHNPNGNRNWGQFNGNRKGKGKNNWSSGSGGGGKMPSKMPGSMNFGGNPVRNNSAPYQTGGNAWNSGNAGPSSWGSWNASVIPKTNVNTAGVPRPGQTTAGVPRPGQPKPAAAAKPPPANATIKIAESKIWTPPSQAKKSNMPGDI